MEKNKTFRKRNFGDKKDSDLDQKIIGIRRVVRVVKGGRRFNFSVVMVVGDGKGSVGLGVGKAADTAMAINKATRMAKKNLKKLNLTEAMSIPHEVRAKYGSAKVILLPNRGRGLVAGGSVRIILALAGVKDVSSKILSRTKNKLNNARATMDALEKLKIRNPKMIK